MAKKASKKSSGKSKKLNQKYKKIFEHALNLIQKRHTPEEINKLLKTGQPLLDVLSTRENKPEDVGKLIIEELRNYDFNRKICNLN